MPENVPEKLQYYINTSYQTPASFTLFPTKLHAWCWRHLKSPAVLRERHQLSAMFVRDWASHFEAHALRRNVLQLNN